MLILTQAPLSVMLSPQPPEEQCNARRLCSGGSVLYVIVNDFDFFLYSELNKNPVEGFSAGLIEDSDLYRWEVLIIGPPDTL